MRLRFVAAAAKTMIAPLLCVLTRGSTPSLADGHRYPLDRSGTTVVTLPAFECPITWIGPTHTDIAEFDDFDFVVTNAVGGRAPVSEFQDGSISYIGNGQNASLVWQVHIEAPGPYTFRVTPQRPTTAPGTIYVTTESALRRDQNATLALLSLGVALAGTVAYVFYRRRSERECPGRAHPAR